MMPGIFGPGGIYARTLKNFENRPDVVREIYEVDMWTKKGRIIENLPFFN